MACRVIRNNDNQIETVYRQDGNPSNIFNIIKDAVKTPNIAYAVYLTALDRVGTEPTVQDVAPFIIDANNSPGKYASLIQEMEFEYAEEELAIHLNDFLNDIGWKTEWLDNIKDTKTGKELDVKGRALVSKKIVQLAKGKADITTLTEETAHALVESLRATDSSLYTTMYDSIESYAIYKQMAEPGSFYYEQYQGNTDK